MNIILEAPDACGKSTLAKKLQDKYGMKIINSTKNTRNDFSYHIDLLDFQENTVFDRFHFGEIIYPQIYPNRVSKLSVDEFDKINKRIIDNNDIFIVFISSDIDILKNRLKERGETDYLKEIEEQNTLFTKYAKEFKTKYNYHNFYIIDIAEDDAYDKLDDWIEQNYNKVNINTAYKQAAKDLLENGTLVKGKRDTIELTNYMFEITDINNCLPYVSLKSAKTSLIYLVGEFLWYYYGRNDVEFIDKFASMWKKISDDGVTNNSAYGYVTQKKFGFNQIDKIIELLKVDPNTRRAVININVPNDKVIETKDEPCTIALIYQIRDNKLNATTVMRSNDIIYGWRNDIFAAIMLQKYIASKLNLEVGTYTHFANSFHVYCDQLARLKAVAYGDNTQLDAKLNSENLVQYSDDILDYISTSWKNKQEFEKLLYNTNILVRV